MTAQSLDEIMAGRDANQPEPSPDNAPATGNQPRDDNGKFAPKGDQQPEPVTQQEPAHTEAEQSTPEKGKVPQQALHAEREKAKSERERADALERQLAELRGQVSVLTQQRQAPQQQVEPPKPRVVWEDPDGWAEEKLTPFQQELQETRFYYSQTGAIRDHGKETVDAASSALQQAVQAGQIDPNQLKTQLSRSIDPVGDVVRWYQQTPAHQEKALREKIRAEIEAEQKPAVAEAQTQPAAKTPMPSNFAGARNEGARSSPVWSGPKPLSEIARGNNQ